MLKSKNDITALTKLSSLNYSQSLTDALDVSHKRYVTVTELAAHCNISIGTIYSFIKAEPDFPYVNVGVKKKFMVDLNQFETWINNRTIKEKHEHFKIPTSLDLAKLFKNNKAIV